MSENNRQLGQTPIFGQLFTYLKKFLLHWNSKSECYNSQIICTKNFIKIFLQGKKLSRLQNPNFVIFCKIMSRLRKSPHMVPTPLFIFNPTIIEPAAGKITAWWSYVGLGCPPTATVLWFFKNKWLHFFKFIGKDLKKVVVRIWE